MFICFTHFGWFNKTHNCNDAKEVRQKTSYLNHMTKMVLFIPKILGIIAYTMIVVGVATVIFKRLVQWQTQRTFDPCGMV